jgi:hypothetical protein
MSTVTPIMVVGSKVAGESSAARVQLEYLVTNLSKSSFDIGELLHKIKSRGFYNDWGFTTYKEYEKTLEIKRRKAQYLRKIAEVTEIAKFDRKAYEPIGIAKLRQITSLDPAAIYVNPTSNIATPMIEFIVGFLEQGLELTLEEITLHVRTLKGFVGDNDFVWRNFSVKRSVAELSVDPAIQLAKNHIGSVGKDEEGVSKDASDGSALEVLAVAFMLDPANNVLPEDSNV